MIEYTSEWVLEHSTDPLDPAEINWPERQARALMPFDVVHGRPRCPVMYGVPGRVARGRNDLKLWGENAMADALVTATHRGVRYVLLIERGDDSGWAMPGGPIEPGESPVGSAARELLEETGLPYIGSFIINAELDEPRWVPDPRGSMEAWAVTVVARCNLGEVDALPQVRGGDDARQAWWVPLEGMGGIQELRIFPAHRQILEVLR